MSEVWAVIVGVILLMVLYGFISSHIKSRRQRKLRGKSLPFVSDNVSPGVLYNVYLSDGKKFLGVELVGTSDPAAGQFTIGGWEGMVVLKQQTGKRVFVRQSSLRWIEEV